jgi:serine/threonine protein kinase
MSLSDEVRPWARVRIDPGAAAIGGSSSRPEDDPRVSAALEDYLGRLRAGRPPDRAAFLAEYAELADALAPCLEGLELVHEAAPDLPLREAAAAMPEIELPEASRLGDFRILRQVGRGGMGVVYEAEQVSLGRRVALKVLPLAAALDPRQLQRFRIEAQAAALLHHPRIVPIYAVGAERGLHYYAMQFIDGPTLAEVVRELARARKEPPGVDDATLTAVPSASGLSLPGPDFARAVARLGRQAAEAIEHAHSLGVLHRDVKPSNLMLDVQGDLWITDFGLARVAANPDLTRTGDLLGTVRYMSPEQAAGNRAVDARSDIYSLGVTLYELLTLRPAFDGSDRQAVLRAIAHDEPPAPRRLDPTIPLDLETIILKAMAKEPAARYATAGELAADLDRFLTDQAIRARRPGPLERAARWSRRHRPVVSTAITVALLTLSIAAALLWRQQRETQAALDQIRAIRERERAAMNASISAADTLIYPLVGLAAAKGVLAGSEGERTYRAAIYFYQRIADQGFEADPDTRSIAARAYSRIGFFKMILRQPDADDAYRKAIELCESLTGNRDGVAYRARQLFIMEEYRNWLAMTDRRAEADRLARRMVETVEAWGDEAPTTSDDRGALASAYNDLAWRILTKPDFPIRDPERAVGLARLATTILPNSPGIGAIWNTVGLALYRIGDDAGAEDALQRAIQFDRGGGTPDDWLILAMVRHRQGRIDEAKQLVEQSHEAMKRAPEKTTGDRVLLDREASQLLGIEPLPPPAPQDDPVRSPEP